MERPFLVIPLTLRRLVVTRSLVEDTRVLLARSGERGFEATTLWLGPVLSEVEARVEEVYFPQQIVYRTEYGLAVEIPVDEWTELALRLPPGRFVLAKLHTHAGLAYHSDVDAENPYLCHEGAVSITVPDFARESLGGLEECSVNVLRQGRWRELSMAESKQTIIVEEDPA
jgi:hypothetical protein